jgi:predicted ATPase
MFIICDGVTKMTKTNYFVLTGAMGSGKSTLIREIGKAGIRCVPEPAREILAEQRAIASDGVPEQNAELFCKLMLSRSLQNYNQGIHASEVQVFDRGIPDMIAYAELFSVNSTSFYKASEQYRYNPRVFFFDGWEAIYTNDSERKISFEGASIFGASVRLIYQKLGYQIVEVPFQSIEERTNFILERLLSK